MTYSGIKEDEHDHDNNYPMWEHPQIISQLQDINLNYLDNRYVSRMIQPYKYTMMRLPDSSIPNTSNHPTTLIMNRDASIDPTKGLIDMTSLEHQRDIKIHNLFNESANNPFV